MIYLSSLHLCLSCIFFLSFFAHFLSSCVFFFLFFFRTPKEKKYLCFIQVEVINNKKTPNLHTDCWTTKPRDNTSLLRRKTPTVEAHSHQRQWCERPPRQTPTPRPQTDPAVVAVVEHPPGEKAGVLVVATPEAPVGGSLVPRGVACR